MIRNFRALLLASIALAGPAWSLALAQEGPVETPLAPLDDAGAPAINEDEMADFLNSQQQIKQDVTLTRTVDGKVIETKKQTIVYSPGDPLRDSEAGLSPIEQLKAEFDSQALTRKEALEEARLDFVIADLDRDNTMNAAEFVYLVKGWQDAKISGSGHGRFVDPYFHVDQAAADAEHAEQARTKFAGMAGDSAMLNKQAFTRKVIEQFEQYDLDKDDLLRGDELLNFRVGVRGETIFASPPSPTEPTEPSE
jgi:hypothetical protein